MTRTVSFLLAGRCNDRFPLLGLLPVAPVISMHLFVHCSFSRPLPPPPPPSSSSSSSSSLRLPTAHLSRFYFGAVSSSSFSPSPRVRSIRFRNQKSETSPSVVTGRDKRYALVDGRRRASERGRKEQKRRRAGLRNAIPIEGTVSPCNVTRLSLTPRCCLREHLIADGQFERNRPA